METAYSNVPYSPMSPDLSVDVGSMLQGYGDRMLELQVRKEEKAAKNRNAFLSQYDAERIKPKEVYESTAGQVSGEINDYISKLSKAVSNGVDPNDPVFRQEMAKNEANIQRLTNMGKEIQGATNTYHELAVKDPGKYNIGDYESWLGGLKDKKTAEEKYDYVKSTTPFKEEVDFVKMFHDHGVNPETLIDRFGNEVWTNKDKVKDQVRSIILNGDPSQRESFMREVFSLKDKDGNPVYESMDAAVNDFADQMMSFAKSKQQPSEPRDLNVDLSTYSDSLGGKWGKNMNVAYSMSSGGTIGNVVVKKGGKDLPIINVTTDTGTNLFSIEKFFTKDGKMYAQGVLKTPGGKRLDSRAISVDDNIAEIKTAMDGFDPRLGLQEYLSNQGLSTDFMDLGGGDGSTSSSQPKVDKGEQIKKLEEAIKTTTDPGIKASLEKELEKWKNYNPTKSKNKFDGVPEGGF